MTVSRRIFLGITASSLASPLIGSAAIAAPAEKKKNDVGNAVPVPKDGIIKGRVWIFGDGIWADSLMPAEAMTMPLGEAKAHCLSDIRPGWAAQVKKGDILLAGKEFGLGSARDASALLKYMGIQAIVAESMMPFFVRNCVNSGVPLMECPNVKSIFKEGDTLEFNLHTGLIKNLTTGKQIQGVPMPEAINDIIIEGGTAAVLKKEGYT